MRDSNDMRWRLFCVALTGSLGYCGMIGLPAFTHIYVCSLWSAYVIFTVSNLFWKMDDKIDTNLPIVDFSDLALIISGVLYLALQPLVHQVWVVYVVMQSILVVFQGGAWLHNLSSQDLPTVTPVKHHPFDYGSSRYVSSWSPCDSNQSNASSLESPLQI